MTTPSTLPSSADIKAVIATLRACQAWLDEAGELLAAVHVDHAVQCLVPEAGVVPEATAAA